MEGVRAKFLDYTGVSLHARPSMMKITAWRTQQSDAMPESRIFI